MKIERLPRVGDVFHWRKDDLGLKGAIVTSVKANTFGYRYPNGIEGELPVMAWFNEAVIEREAPLGDPPTSTFDLISNSPLHEIRYLLAEAHTHIDQCAECACGRSTDGHITLNWSIWDDEPTITVGHRCAFDAQEFYWDDLPDGVIDHGHHRTTFANIEHALREVRLWHSQEMRKDHADCPQVEP